MIDRAVGKNRRWFISNAPIGESWFDGMDRITLYFFAVFLRTTLFVSIVCVFMNLIVCVFMILIVCVFMILIL